ncbi:MAG: endonuclease [Deltaproteobacteria bacterium]|nr:endonuclease [Deltaproteobacteria bacterium]
MSDTVSTKHVGVALQHIREALATAAGKDRALTRDEAERCLTSMVTTERAAVDAFVGVLRQGTAGNGLITTDEIDAAVAALRSGVEASGTSGSIPAETVRQLSRMGDTLVRLASRLSGEPSAVLPPLPKGAFPGLSGDALLSALRTWAAPHLQFDYGTARDLLYGAVDGKGGVVHDVYGGRDVAVRPRKELEEHEHINAEHTRPRSTGVKGTPANTDLHHLFPTDQEANNRRGNLPFGEVVEELWRQGDARMGTDQSGALVFEPPDEHKGNVARALFYVAAVYGLALPPDEERVLRGWHRLDPVSGQERARNDAISTLQENRNPFVDDPGLVDRVTKGS